MRAREPLLRCHDDVIHPYPDGQEQRLRCERYMWHKGPHMAETLDPKEDPGLGLFMWEHVKDDHGPGKVTHAAMFYNRTFDTAPKRIQE